MEDQTTEIAVSSYDVVGFFLLTELVTCISRLILSCFSDQTRSYQRTMHSTE